MNDFDIQDIKNMTKAKIAISNFQSNNSMEKNRKSKIVFWTRILTSISACIIFSCGIIFSEEISVYIYDYAMSNKIEQTTINNGNMARFSGEYTISEEEIIDLQNNNQGLSQDNVKLKVEDITMDDNNLEIKFNMELSDEIYKKLNTKRGLDIKFQDLLITDENNNVLVSLNEDKAIQILNIDYEAEYQKNPKCERDEIKENSLLANERYFGGNIRSYVLKCDEKNVKVVYSMNLVGQSKYYPRCKNLKFEIGKIKILNDMESDYGGIVLNYQGKWSMTLELPENIVNRKRTSYNMLENESLQENKIVYFNTLESGSEIKLSLKAPEVVESDTSPQLNLINTLEVENPSTQIRDYFVDELMASDEYIKYEDDLRKRYMIQDAYIEDENGKQYRNKRGAYSNWSGNITEDGFYEPTLLLEFSKKDIKNNLKLHVTYFDKEYIFDLVKEAEV